MFRVSDDTSNFMIERKYTEISMLNSIINKQSRIGRDEFILSFIISLVPHGKMSSALFNIKEGKRLLIQGPRKVKDEFWNKINHGVNQCKFVFMLAAGTGILPLIQIIDYHLHQHSGNVRFFLVWLIKGPKHGYEKTLGLNDRERKSRGYFKWVAFYTSRNIEEPVNRKKVITSVAQKATIKMRGMGTRKCNMAVSDLASRPDNQNSERKREHAWDKGFWEKKYRERQYAPELLCEILASIEKDNKSFAKRCRNRRSLILADDDYLEDEEVHNDVEESKNSQCDYLDLNNKLALVSGSPAFDQATIKHLKNLGYGEDQVITFRFCE